MKNITRLFVAAAMLLVSTFAFSGNIIPQCSPNDPQCVPVELQIANQPQIIPQCDPGNPDCHPVQ